LATIGVDTFFLVFFLVVMMERRARPTRVISSPGRGGPSAPRRHARGGRWAGLKISVVCAVCACPHIRRQAVEDGQHVLVAPQVQGLLGAAKDGHLERRLARLDHGSADLDVLPRPSMLAKQAKPTATPPRTSPRSCGSASARPA
jgi:hypothetical protein